MSNFFKKYVFINTVPIYRRQQPNEDLKNMIPT